VLDEGNDLHRWCSGGHSSAGGTGGAGHACMTGPSCSPASSAVPIMTSASPWYSSDLVTALNPPRRMTSVKERSGRASAGTRRDVYRDRGRSSGACVHACRSSRAASKPPCAPLHDHHVRSTGGSSTSLSARSSLFDTGSVLTHSMGRCVVAAGTVVVLSHWSRDLTADPRWPGRAGGARPPARLRNSESHPSRPLAVLLGLRGYPSSVPRYSA
jgi:hypothetical protein